MFLAVALIVVLLGLDRALKIFMPSLLADGATVDLIPGFLQLRYTENTGAAFGILGNSTALLSVLTGIVLVVLVYFFLFGSRKSNLLRYSLALLIAGGLGNLFDRVFYGFVVDYFEFTFVRFAIFNAADCFITVGVVLLMIYFLFIDGKQQAKEQLAAGGEADEYEDDALRDADGELDDEFDREPSESYDADDTGEFD